MNNWFNPDIIKTGMLKGLNRATAYQLVCDNIAMVGQVATEETYNIVRELKQKGILEDNYNTEEEAVDKIKHAIFDQWLSFTKKRLINALQEQYPRYASTFYTSDIMSLIESDKLPAEVEIFVAKEFDKANKDFLENVFNRDVSLIRKEYGLPEITDSFPSYSKNSVTKKTTSKTSLPCDSSDVEDSKPSPDNIHKKHKKKPDETFGIVFWIALLGIYFLTSADLISSIIGALFFAAVAYFLS